MPNGGIETSSMQGSDASDSSDTEQTRTGESPSKRRRTLSPAKATHADEANGCGGDSEKNGRGQPARSVARRGRARTGGASNGSRSRARVPAGIDDAATVAPADSYATNWLFTTNDPTEADEPQLGDNFRRIVWQLERGAEGTEHYQGRFHDRGKTMYHQFSFFQ